MIVKKATVEGATTTDTGLGAVAFSE